jgi:hypothetical protein
LEHLDDVLPLKSKRYFSLKNFQTLIFYIVSLIISL